MAEKDGSKFAAWVTAVRGVIYTVIALVGILLGALLWSIKFVETVEAGDLRSKTNAVEVIEIKSAVKDLGHKIETAQRAVDEMKKEIAKLGDKAEASALEMVKLQTKVDNFKIQQSEMLRVLVKIGKTVENGNGR